MANAGISEGFSSLYKVEQDRPVEPDTKVVDVNVFGVVYCTPIYSRESELKGVGLLIFY